MDSKASTSEISNDNLKPENEKLNRKKKGVKKHDDLKEFEENINVEKKDLVITKKKGSISSTKSSSKEFKNDNDRKDLNQMKEEMDEQKPSTSKASQLSPKISFKQKFVTSKKLSVEEIQRPFDSLKLSSKRRRSSIPDFSQEECAGTNPALFIWPKKSFKDSLVDQEEYLPSDPIESEIDDIESESLPPDDNMVVSESTIMFVHPDTSSSASQENVFTSKEHQEEGFHISSSDVDDDDDDDDFVDDAYDNSEMSENAYDIFLEEIDAKTGTTIVTPRSSDSESDLLSSSGAELMQETNVDSKVEMCEQPILKLSNAFVDEPLEVILEESKNDKPIISDQNHVQPTSKIPEIFENNLECVETVKEVSLQKPPRPPSKKISINLDTQQPSTCAAETFLCS